MDGNMRQQHMFRREILGKSVSTICGFFLIILTVAIGCFLLAKGMLTFTDFHHSIGEFLFSSAWKPSDTDAGGGQVGAAIFIWGSILTCFLALLIAIPFSLSTAVFMTQISPRLGEKLIRPAVGNIRRHSLRCLRLGGAGGAGAIPAETVQTASRAVSAGSGHRPFRHDLSHYYLRFCRCHPQCE